MSRASEADGTDAGGTGTGTGQHPAVHVAVLAGAVVATLAPMAAAGLVVIVTAVWSMAGTGTAGSLAAVRESVVFIGLAGAVTMVGVYAVGVPLALLIEHRTRQRTALRLVAYGIAGAMAGVTVGVAWLSSGPSAMSITSICCGFGLVSALAGGGVVSWVRRRPAALARRVADRGSVVLIAGAAAGWVATGAIFIPLVIAAIAAAVVVVMVRLLPRRAALPARARRDRGTPD